MQEMLYPTSYLKSKGLAKSCSLITDGRFSGGSSGLSIGHVSPEAAEGGMIGLIENGDPIVINIPQRLIRLDVDEQILNTRRAAMEVKGSSAWQPVNRERQVSSALRAYATFASNAARGGAGDSGGCGTVSTEIDKHLMEEAQFRAGWRCGTELFMTKNGCIQCRILIR